MMGYSQQQQQGTYGGTGYSQPTMASRQRQQVGRTANCCRPRQGFGGPAATPSTQMQMQMLSRNNATCAPPRGRAAPNAFCENVGPGPAPINVNISAAQLASAGNQPTQGSRQEAGMEGNPGVKYIPLSWEDILGKTGMNVRFKFLNRR